MKLKVLAIIVPMMLLTGCGDQSKSAGAAGGVQVSLATQNVLNNKITGVVLTPNASTVVKFYNSSNSKVSDLQLNTNSLPTGVAVSGACASILPSSSCSITLTSDNIATGTGSISLTGSSIKSVNMPVTVTPVNLNLAAVQRGNETQSTLRGLKYQEIKLTNSTGYTVALQSTNDIAPSVPNLMMANDSAHTDGTCLSSSTTGTCNFWVTTDNGPDVGKQSFDNLTFTYLVNNENIETQTFPFTGSSIETDLYMAGAFQTKPNTCNNNNTLTQCYDLAKWDGTQWNAVGGEAYLGDGEYQFYPVQDITTDPNGNIDLVLGGDPSAPLTATTNYLASWDGVTWGNMGGGIPGFEAADLSVTAMGYLAWDTYTDPKAPVLYFFYQNSQLSDQWLLGSWSPTANSGQGELKSNIFNFSTAPNINGFVGVSLVTNKGSLYLAQQSKTAGVPGGVVFASVHDLNAWQPLSSSFTFFVPEALLLNNDTLYVSGSFSPTTSAPEYHLEAYDLKESSPSFKNYVSAGSSQRFFAQQIFGDTLYFTNVDGSSNPRLYSAPTSQSLPITQSSLLGTDNVQGGVINGPKALVMTSNGSSYLAGSISGVGAASGQSSCITKQTGGTWRPLNDSTGSSDISGCMQGYPEALVLTPTLTIK